MPRNLLRDDAEDQEPRRRNLLREAEPETSATAANNSDFARLITGDRPAQSPGLPRAAGPWGNATNIAVPVASDVGRSLPGLPSQVVGGVMDAANNFPDAMPGTRQVERGLQWLADNSPVAGVADAMPWSDGKDTVEIGNLPTTPRSDTVTGNLVRGVSQFAAPFGAASKMTGGMRGLGAGARFLKSTALGAGVDFAAFDPDEGRLADIIESVPGLSNPVTRWLQTDEDDTALEGRIKNVIEGAGLGAAFEGIMSSLRRAKASQRTAASAAAGEAADDILETGKPRDMADLDAEDFARRAGSEQAGAMADEVRAARRANRESGPASLARFLKDSGGLVDQGGELAARDLNRARPGLVNNASGRTLDDAAEAAWNAGYFQERPSIDDLLNALDNEVRGGQRIFSPEDAAEAARREDLEGFTQSLDQQGIDYSARRDADLRESLARTVDDPGEGSARTQADLDAEQAAMRAAGQEYGPYAARREGAARPQMQAPENLQADPDVSALRDVIAKPEPSTPAGRVRADMKATGTRSTFDKYAAKAYTALVDRKHPINMAVQRLTGGKLDLKTTENPYRLAQLASGSRERGHMDIIEGVSPYRSAQPASPSLSGAVETALGKDWSDDQIKNLNAYLVARRARAEWDRFNAGKLDREPIQVSQEQATRAAAKLEAATPQFAEAAEQVYNWATALWRKKLDAGLITPEQYQQGLDAHPDYVPFLRDLGASEYAGAPKSGKTGKGGMVRGFKGSDRAILDPISSIAREAYETAQAIDRNDTFKALRDLAERTGDDSLIKPVPNIEFSPVKVDALEAVHAAAKRQGLADRDVASLMHTLDESLQGKTTGNIFQPGFIDDQGRRLVFVWENGKRQPLEIVDDEFGRDLHKSLTGLNDEARNAFVDIAAAPSYLLRAGITTSPDFIVSNFIRDNVAAWVLLDDYKPFIDGGRGLAEYIRNTPVAQAYKRTGGIVGGANADALHELSVKKDIRALKDKGVSITRLKEKPLRALTVGSEFSESATRVGAFRKAYANAKMRGMDEWDAMNEAAFEARDYIDFSRHGASMDWARKIVPFLNVGIQGLDKARRTAFASVDGRTNPKRMRSVLAPLFDGTAQKQSMTAADKAAVKRARKMWLKMSALAATGLSITAANYQNPEYSEISDYLRATHWMLPAGERKWIAIPKPFELALLSNITERAYEGVIGRDPTAWRRMAAGSAELLVPPHSAPGLTVPVEQMTNTNLYTGGSIVPPYKEALEPGMQSQPYSSFASRAAGEAANVSPSRIDHVIHGFGGSWGRGLTGTSNMLDENAPAPGAEDAFVSRRFVRDVTRGSTSGKQFWKEKGMTGTGLTRASRTYGELLDTGKDTEAAQYLARLDDYDREFAILQEHGDAEEKRAHPMTRAHNVVGAIGDLRDDLFKESMRAGGTGKINGEKVELPALKLSKDQKRRADDALSYLALVEQRNALIESGNPEWRNKPPMDRDKAMRDLAAVHPQLPERLKLLTSGGSRKAMPYEDMRKLWPEVQGAIRSRPEFQSQAKPKSGRNLLRDQAGASSVPALLGVVDDVGGGAPHALRVVANGKRPDPRGRAALALVRHRMGEDSYRQALREVRRNPALIAERQPRNLLREAQ